MSNPKKPEPTLVSIAIQRVDTYTFRLIQVHNGQTKTLAQDTFGLVRDKADLILQKMAEGTYLAE